MSSMIFLFFFLVFSIDGAGVLGVAGFFGVIVAGAAGDSVVVIVVIAAAVAGGFVDVFGDFKKKKKKIQTEKNKVLPR